MPFNQLQNTSTNRIQKLIICQHSKARLKMNITNARVR